MKRSQLNAGLLVLGLGLAVVVFLSQKKEEKGAPLTPFSAGSVERIALEHPDAPTILLEKRGTQWWLTAPVQTRAEVVEIDAILALATLEAKSTLDVTQVQLADLGLAPAQYRVKLNDMALDFGGTEPLQFRRYVKTGDKIALVDDPPSPALDADYSDLVDKNLLPADADIADVRAPGLDYAKAGELQKKALTAAWKNARAMWMAMDTPEPARGDAVRVTLKDGTALDFTVVERDPQLVLARTDLKVRYTLSKVLADELLRLPAIKADDAAGAKAAPAASK